MNLSLAITGIRSDGFHELISAVVPVNSENLSDEIELAGTIFENDFSQKKSRGNDNFLCCDVPEIPTDESNLILKATKLFREKFKIENAEFRWNLKKKIPHGAGLGGGSSNAATALILLKKFYENFKNSAAGTTKNPEIREREIFEIAEKLGSDVPLFLKKKPVLMRGRGEKIEEFSDKEIAILSEKKFVVFKPNFEISTAGAYAEMKKNPRQYYVSAEFAEEKISVWRKNPNSQFPYFNNMELPAFRKFLALPAIFEILQKKHKISPRMSGSGSACFAEILDFSAVPEIEKTLRENLGNDIFIQKISLK